MLKMHLRQPFMKVWIFWSAFLVCLQVSDQIHRGELILHWHLKMRSFVCVLISLDIQMFLSMLNASLALPILAAMSTSVPPCLSITLPRYVKESTSSNRSPSTVTGFSLMVLILMTIDLPLIIFSPVLF